jgi:hypothetical protein
MKQSSWCGTTRLVNLREYYYNHDLQIVKKIDLILVTQKNVALLLYESLILKHSHKYVINKNFKTF